MKVNPIFVRTTRLPKLVRGFMLFPFIFLNKAYDSGQGGKYLRNHETIHFKQALETMVIGFYILYAFHFIRNRVKGDSNLIAYRGIPFESEAYKFENDLGYLDRRKKFAWR